MINPWDELDDSALNIDLSALKKLTLEESKKLNKNTRVRKYEVKNKDYETYNYLVNEDNLRVSGPKNMILSESSRSCSSLDNDWTNITNSTNTDNNEFNTSKKNSCTIINADDSEFRTACVNNHTIINADNSEFKTSKKNSHANSTNATYSNGDNASLSNGNNFTGSGKNSNNTNAAKNSANKSQINTKKAINSRPCNESSRCSTKYSKPSAENSRCSTTTNSSSSNSTESDSTKIGSKSNTLLSILVRANDVKKRRKNLHEIANEKISSNMSKKIELEKKIVEHNKKVHQQILFELNSKYSMKKKKAEMWRENERRRIILNKKAMEHYEDKLIRKYFRRFKIVLVIRRKKEKMADNFFKNYILKKTFQKLKKNRENVVEKKNEMANDFYSKKLLKFNFSKWLQNHNENTVLMKKAEKFHAVGLLRKTFKIWGQFHFDEKIQMRNKFDYAKFHLNRKLRQMYFNKWKEFVKIVKNNLKFRPFEIRLRNAVLSVLPDFNPPVYGDEEDEE